MNKIIENTLKDYCNKKASTEIENFRKIYEEIKKLQKENKDKGYKDGKLYFDILKKYELKEIFKNEIVHAVYKILAKNYDYDDVEEMLLEKAHALNDPDITFSQIAINFLEFTRKESMKIGKAIPAEELKNVLENSYKNFSAFGKDLNQVKNIIIENDPKSLILEALDFTELEGLSSEKIKELKAKVEASFSK